MSKLRQPKLKAMLIAGAAMGVMSMQATAAFAADAPSGANNATNVDEVLVTASKRTESLHNVAMGISAIRGEDLDRRQLRSFADYASLVPGLQVQQGSPVINKIIIRGLNAGGGGATVGTYVDDSPIGSSNALAQGAIFTANIDTSDLERLEVLRGPQGTLYGSNTEGGLIKFVANAPNLAAYSSTVQVGAETVDGGSTAGMVHGVVNVPLPGGRSAFRVSGYYDQIPGFIDDPYRHLKDVNKGYSAGFRGAFLFRPSENFDIKLSVHHQAIHVDAPAIVDVVGSAYTYATPPANIFSPVNGDLTQTRFDAQPNSSTITNYAATENWKIGSMTLTSITSYSLMKEFRRGDTSGLSAAFFPPATAGAPFGQPVSYYYYLTNFVYGIPTYASQAETMRLRKYTEELRLASDTSGRLQWQIGGFATKETTRDYFFLRAANALTNATLVPEPGFEFVDATYNEVAAFASIDYKFTDTFDVELGGRYSHNNQTEHLYSAPSFILGPETDLHFTSSESVFTFSVSPRLHLSDNTLVYGRIANGYRPGGPNLVPPGAPPNFPKTYGADKTINYEVGLRTNLLDHKFSADVAAFLINWDNIQIPTRFGIYGLIGNGGTATSRGFEWAFGFHPVPGLNFTYNGAYVDAYLTADAPGEGGLKGDALAAVPKWSSSLDGEYRWTAFGEHEAYVGATYAYTGKRYTDIGTIPMFTPHILLPSYGTIALRAGLDLNNLRLELFAKNVGNSRGINGYGNSGALNLMNPAFPILGTKSIIAPRTIGFTVTAKFQ